MPIHVRCDQCGRSYEVQDAFAGQRVACPSCRHPLLIPTPSQSPSLNYDLGTARHTIPDTETIADALILEDEAPSPVAPRRSEPPRRPAQPRPSESELEPTSRNSALPALLLALAFLLLVGSVGVTLIVLAKKPAAPATSEQELGQVDGKPNDGKPKTEPPAKPPDKPPERRTEPRPSATAWKGHKIGVVALGVSADGRFVLSAAGGIEVQADEQIAPAADTCVIRWNARTGEEVSRLNDFKDGISAAAFSADGRFVAVVSAGKTVGDNWLAGADIDIHIWDLEKRREVTTLHGHEKMPFCLAFAPDGSHLASGGLDRYVAVWDLATQKAHFMPGHQRAVNAVVFRADGRQILSASGDRSVRVWDVDKAKEVTTLPGHKDIVWSLAVSANGNVAASGGGNYYDDARGKGFTPGARDYDVRLWDLNKCEETARLVGHSNEVNALAVSADGRRVLSGGKDMTVRLWQVAGARQTEKYEGHTREITAVVFLPDGRRGLSAAADGSLRVHELPLDLPDLVKRLDGPRDAELVETVRQLATYGPEAAVALPALLALLPDGDAALRRATLATLPKLGPPGKDHVERLLPLLKMKHVPEAQVYALDALTALGADAVPATPTLIGLLSAEDIAVRRKVIGALGAFGPPARKAAFQPLLEALRDADATVSRDAGAALLKLGAPDKEHIPTLTKLLESPRDSVRLYAVAALGDFGPDAASALPALLALYRPELVADTRLLILRTLGHVGPRDRSVLDLCTRSLREGNPELGKVAVETLAAAGPELALPGLLLALEDADATISGTAEKALRQGPLRKEQVPLLVAALDGKKESTRLCLLDVLVKLGPDAAEAVPALVRILKGPDSAVRKRTVTAVGELGPTAKEAAPTIVVLLRDVDATTRFDLIEVLRKMEAPELAQAVPFLVKSLKIDMPMDEGQQATRKKAQDALTKMGKPAVPALTTALAEDFSSGGFTPAGMLNAEARLTILQTLEAIGPAARNVETLRVVARVAGSDPYPLVRAAADKTRMKLQEK